MTSSRDKKRLADALADAGVGARRVAIEVLYLLPEGFVREYELLFHEALSLGDEGKGGVNDAQATLGRAASGLKGGSGGGSRRHSVFPVKSEAALEKKLWVDRQLRKLTRAMQQHAGASETAGINATEGRYRCGQRTERSRNQKRGCGKWQEKNWIYCPYCGTQNRTKIVNTPPSPGRP